MIRYAKPEDLKILVSLGASTFEGAYREHFEKDFTLDALVRYLALTFNDAAQQRELADPERKFLLVETDEGTVAGYAKVVRTTNQYRELLSPSCFIERIYIGAAFQNKNIGSSLLEAIHGLARELGTKDMYLNVWEGNLRAIRFYVRHGYRAFAKETFAVTGSGFSDLDVVMKKTVDQIRRL